LKKIKKKVTERPTTAPLKQIYDMDFYDLANRLNQAEQKQLIGVISYYGEEDTDSFYCQPVKEESR